MTGFIKQDFVKKRGGANQNFPHKEGAKDWGIGAKRWGLERFRILKGLAKKRGVTFLREGLIPWCLLCYQVLRNMRVWSWLMKVALNDKTE